MLLFFFFQAEDGIRDLVRSRGLGDVYKRQVQIAAEQGGIIAGGCYGETVLVQFVSPRTNFRPGWGRGQVLNYLAFAPGLRCGILLIIDLSLIHI